MYVISFFYKENLLKHCQKFNFFSIFLSFGKTAFKTLVERKKEKNTTKNNINKITLLKYQHIIRRNDPRHGGKSGSYNKEYC